MQVKLKDILPNPFRDIENYPINREKVEALKTSFEKTEFWDNVVGRINKEGKPELAYGHHRWVALLESYGPRHEIDLIIRNLDDATMIQIMANENMDDWGTNAIVDIETVAAVVKAFGEGKIELPKANPRAAGGLRGSMRYAPSFIPEKLRNDTHVSKSYTAQGIGEFLSWLDKDGTAQDKIHTALTALQYIEEGIITLKAFDGISSSGIRAVVSQASQARSYKQSQADEAARRAKYAQEQAEEAKRREEKAEKDAEKYRAQQRREEELRAREEARAAAQQREESIKAKARAEAEARARRKEGQENARKVTEAVGKHLRSGGGVKTAPEAAIKAVPAHQRKQPKVEEYLRKAVQKVGGYLWFNDPVVDQLNRVIEFKADIDPDLLADAAKTFEHLAERATRWADEFKSAPKQEQNAKSGRLALKNR